MMKKVTVPHMVVPPCPPKISPDDEAAVLLLLAQVKGMLKVSVNGLEIVVRPHKQFCCQWS